MDPEAVDGIGEMGGQVSKQKKVKREISDYIQVVDIPIMALTGRKGRYDIIYSRLNQIPPDKAFEVSWKEMGYESPESLCSSVVTHARKHLSMALGSHIEGDKCYLWKRSGK